jgi:hypothetical protein
VSQSRAHVTTGATRGETNADALDKIVKQGYELNGQGKAVERLGVAVADASEGFDTL